MEQVKVKKGSEEPASGEQELYVWEAAARTFRKRGKDFYSTVVVLAMLISVIMFFIEGLVPVFLIWAIVFVVWAISKTEPEEVEYKLTTKGVRTGGQLYLWEEMVFFWIEKKEEGEVVRVVLSRRFPGQLGLVVGGGEEKKIKEIMGARVEYDEPEATWMDRFIVWFKKKVPLEE